MSMGWFALLCALVAVLCAVLPGAALFVALGLGIASLGLGLLGYRRKRDPGAARLAGAGAMGLGLVALILASVRYGIVLAVVQRLQSML
ncbi:hypothetical protein [Haliangium ochraceum]|uniref:hypothetical protein n=1 Tax=Haliangium ochraceum TaxID=80816 RepID=UPI0018EF71D0|nr:hypothetical protein [Haliangium ochraceum]